jgi:hypothetical protein
MLVPNTPRSWLPGVFITRECRLSGVLNMGESRLLSVINTWESFWTPRSRFTDFNEHTTIFKGTIIIKIDCTVLPKDSNQLPAAFITESHIGIRIIPHEYSEKLEIVSGHAYWDQEKLFDNKKNQRRKISWHCLFKPS